MIGLALVRLVALPVLTLLTVLPPHEPDSWWWVLTAIATVWVVGGGIVLVRWRGRQFALATLLVDIVIVAMAIEVSGGAESDLIFVAPLIVPIVAMHVRPVGGALLWFGALGAWSIPIVADVVAGESGSLELFAIWIAISVYVLAEAVPVAGVRARARARLASLSEQRMRLTARLAAVEEAGRERVSRELHDGPLQALFAARQDLDSAADRRAGIGAGGARRRAGGADGDGRPDRARRAAGEHRRRGRGAQSAGAAARR